MEEVNALHIVLATDDNFAKYCCVTIASILDNADDNLFFYFHILDGGLSDKSKKRFCFKNWSNYEVFFYDMSAFDVSKFSLFLEYTSIATYYRLFLTEILPKNVDKVLYLDCDLIAVKNIKELWGTDITEYYAAVIEDYYNNIAFDYLKPVIDENYCYFNAGVMLFNLKKLRENKFLEKCLDFYNQHENQLYYQDQDILNFVLAGKCKYLPIAYNMQTAFYFKKIRKSIKDRNIEYNKKNVVIIHYTYKYKPWHIFYYHPMKKEYQKYLVRVNNNFENLFYQLKNLCRVVFL